VPGNPKTAAATKASDIVKREKLLIIIPELLEDRAISGITVPVQLRCRAYLILI
jgi:hypothetical protein